MESIANITKFLGSDEDFQLKYEVYVKKQRVEA